MASQSGPLRRRAGAERVHGRSIGDMSLEIAGQLGRPGIVVGSGMTVRRRFWLISTIIVERSGPWL